MSSQLRIAVLLNPFTLQGKGGTHAPALARELLDRGHALRGFGAPSGAIPRTSAESTDPDAEDGEISGAGVSGFRPDVVVAYDALSPAAFFGARISRRLAVPLVLVESGYAGPGRIHQRALRGIGERLWGAYVRRTAARVVALDPVARELVLREGFAAERVEALPAGIDLTRFRPGLLSSSLTQHRIRGRAVLYIGRIAERRGLEVLIEAFARTVGQRSDWSLVLAGDGPVQRRLRALADRLGIGARLAWLPRPRPEELPGLMGGCTLLAVPAVDETVQGTNIPRAMACGLPVIASDLPRFRFLVEDEGSGLLALPGDLDAWIAALGHATGDPEARQRWSRRARELAESRLSWSRVAAEFERLFVAVRAEAEELHPHAAEAAGADS